MRQLPVRCAIVLSILALVSAARPAMAGPPFLCHPFDIDSAASLPWGDSSTHGSWLNARPDYDVHRLVDDTMTLLTPTAPVMVRMETLRRATIYATRDRQAAIDLMKAFGARAAKLKTQGRDDALP